MVFNALNTIWSSGFNPLNFVVSFIHLSVCHINIKLGSLQQTFWISDHYQNNIRIYKEPSNDPCMAILDFRLTQKKS